MKPTKNKYRIYFYLDNDEQLFNRIVTAYDYLDACDIIREAFALSVVTIHENSGKIK